MPDKHATVKVIITMNGNQSRSIPVRSFPIYLLRRFCHKGHDEQPWAGKNNSTTFAFLGIRPQPVQHVLNWMAVNANRNSPSDLCPGGLPLREMAELFQVATQHFRVKYRPEKLREQIVDGLKDAELSPDAFTFYKSTLSGDTALLHLLNLMAAQRFVQGKFNDDEARKFQAYVATQPGLDEEMNVCVRIHADFLNHRAREEKTRSLVRRAEWKNKSGGFTLIDGLDKGAEEDHKAETKSEAITATRPSIAAGTTPAPWINYTRPVAAPLGSQSPRPGSPSPVLPEPTVPVVEGTESSSHVVSPTIPSSPKPSTLEPSSEPILPAATEETSSDEESKEAEEAEEEDSEDSDDEGSDDERPFLRPLLPPRPLTDPMFDEIEQLSIDELQIYLANKDTLVKYFKPLQAALDQKIQEMLNEWRHKLKLDEVRMLLAKQAVLRSFSSSAENAHYGTHLDFESDWAQVLLLMVHGMKKRVRDQLRRERRERAERQQQEEEKQVEEMQEGEQDDGDQGTRYEAN